MHEVTLLRYYGDFYCTLGIWSIQGIIDPIFHTIEPPWLNNEKKVSCIPSGTYIVEPFHNPKYTLYPDVWRVKDVHNRTGIDIHPLNKAYQSKGCIGVGLTAGYMKYTNIPKVMNNNNGMGKAIFSSANAMLKIKDLIGYKPFKLTIIGGQHVTVS